MTWDFAEGNPFSQSTGNYVSLLRWIEKNLQASCPVSPGRSLQDDASAQSTTDDKVVSTDPPYYDNIGYGDLSDFFYISLRRTLKPVFSQLFGTMAVPKTEELVATPYRHGTKAAAEKFFLRGMTRALRRLAEQAHPGFPVTVYYAFKQSETKRGTGTASTGWETFLDAAIRSGFAITGTWPMRTELANRMIGRGSQRPGLLHRPSLSTPPRRRPPGHPARVPHRATRRTPQGHPPPPVGQHRARSTSPRPPLGPGWRYTPATGRCSTPAGSR